MKSEVDLSHKRYNDRHIITPAIAHEILEGIRQGKTLKQIAIEKRLTSQAIGSYMRKKGVSIRNEKKRATTRRKQLASISKKSLSALASLYQS